MKNEETSSPHQSCASDGERIRVEMALKRLWSQPVRYGSVRAVKKAKFRRDQRPRREVLLLTADVPIGEPERSGLSCSCGASSCLSRERTPQKLHSIPPIPGRRQPDDDRRENQVINACLNLSSRLISPTGSVQFQKTSQDAKAPPSVRPAARDGMVARYPSIRSAQRREFGRAGRMRLTSVHNQTA